MFSRVLKPVSALAVQNGAKSLSTTSQNNYKVVVCGAAGGIGQPLSLLLKQNPLVSHLALYDVAPVTPGVGADLSHMNTPAKVTAHKGPEELANAIKDANLVVIPAGVPRKPGMTRDDLFNTNASIVLEITKVVSAVAPNAVMAIITNPVNSMVPIAAEVHKKMGTYDPRRVLGVTTLDVVRSDAFIGEILNKDPREVDVPVIGGHSGVTILPLISQSSPPVSLDADKLDKLTRRIQEAGTEVVKAKAGGGSATLSMAFAGHRLADAVLRGFKGEKVVECTYLENNLTEAKYFATKCVFGPKGVAEIRPFGKLSDYEQKLLKEAIPELIKNIKTGEDFAKLKA